MTEPDVSLIKNKLIDHFLKEHPNIPFSNGGIIVTAEVMSMGRDENNITTISARVSARRFSGEVVGFKTYNDVGIKAGLSIKIGE